VLQLAKDDACRLGFFRDCAHCRRDLPGFRLTVFDIVFNRREFIALWF